MSIALRSRRVDGTLGNDATRAGDRLEMALRNVHRRETGSLVASYGTVAERFNTSRRNSHGVPDEEPTAGCHPMPTGSNDQ